jgi:cell division protein FtsL
MDKVLVITSIVTAVAVLIYTVFAGLQWWAIRKQGAYASDQVREMQGQLDAIEKQAGIMELSLGRNTSACGTERTAGQGY